MTTPRMPRLRKPCSMTPEEKRQHFKLAYQEYLHNRTTWNMRERMNFISRVRRAASRIPFDLDDPNDATTFMYVDVLGVKLGFHVDPNPSPC